MIGIARLFRTVSGVDAAAVALAATVFCMVLGSSSVSEVVGPGRKLRWLALLALATVAVAMVWRDRARPERRWPVALFGLASFLCVVSLASTAWSVDPRLTFARAASFALLFVTAGSLAVVARTRPQLPGRLLLGILGGAAAASFAGLVMLAVPHVSVLAPVPAGFSNRYRGLGENPDTLAMLEGLALPIALWQALDGRRALGRVVSALTAALLLGSISVSDSRGGLLAAAVGGLTFALLRPGSWRRRLSLTIVVAVAMAGSLGGTRVSLGYGAGSGVSGSTSSPQPGSQGSSGSSGGSVPIGAHIGGPERRWIGPLGDELFRTYEGDRRLFILGGRLEAWYEGVLQGNARPLLGFGFGTEEKVFVDRILNFQSSRVENSLVGFYLQLGLVGALALFALLAAILASALRSAWRAPAGVGTDAALLGAVAAGVALTLVQSYVYAVGNVASVAFWTAGFVAAAGTPAAARVRTLVRSSSEGAGVAAS